MKDIREILNISYFDNKELNLKEHCNIYSNIKKDLISILNKYDIKYVVADTELIRDLSKENQELKKQLEDKENQQKEFVNYLEDEINLFEKYMKNIERSDRPHGDYPITYWSSKYRLNEVAEILSKYKEIIGGDNK